MGSTDTRIFTNEGGVTLSKRLNTILSNNTQYFDVVVGYFYLTGFYKIYKSLENVDRIRIIVGMGTDQATINLLPLYRDNETILKAKAILRKNVKKEFASVEENQEIEEGVKKFIEYIDSGKLQIRAYPSKRLHSKVYIMLKKRGK